MGEPNRKGAGQIVAVSISAVRTDPKENQPEVELIEGYGIQGDSHAGISKRHVSLLGIEAIEELNAAYHVGARPGQLAENITTRGIDLIALRLGQRLSAGSAVLEVVQIGKPPEEPATYSFKGHCLLPTKGIFCRVIRGGRIRPGDAIQVDAAGT